MYCFKVVVFSVFLFDLSIGSAMKFRQVHLNQPGHIILEKSFFKHFKHVISLCAQPMFCFVVFQVMEANETAIPTNSLSLSP